jgi:hypothetical protein
MSTNPSEPPATDPAKSSKRHRSPSYPFVDLKRAVELARIMWEKEKRHPASIPVVCGHWNLSTKSSAGVLSVAALKKFGFLTEEGGGDSRTVRLSDFGLEIIKNLEVPEELQKLLKAAALKPQIHRELWNTHREASDASIRRHLVFDLKFNDNSADAVVKEYRSTIAFAKLTGSDTVADTPSEEEEENTDTMTANSTLEQRLPETGRTRTGREIAKEMFPPPPPHTPIGLIEIPVPLPSGAMAYYRLPPTINESDFNFYQALLNAYRPGLVKGLRSYPCQAIWKNKDGDKPVTIVGTMGAANGITYYMSADKTGIPETELEFQ